MKIVDLKIEVIPSDRMIQFTTAIPPLNYGVLLVRVITDEGIEGNASPVWHGSGYTLAHTLVHQIKPLILGEDPLNRIKVWDKLWSASRLLRIPAVVHGSIDVALWDIAGKKAQMPIYQLLGGFREKVRAYASTVLYPSVDRYVAHGRELVEQGFTAIKLHVFGIWEKDLEVCRSMRKELGGTVELMPDPSGVYDRRQALRVGRIIQDLGYYWYEEPMRDADVEGYIDLCRALDIPIAGGETAEFHQNSQYIMRGAFDILRPDAMINRGISPQIRVAGMCEAFGMKCEIHSHGSPLTQGANLHVIAAVKNCDFYEFPVPAGLYDFFMKDTIGLDAEGFVHVPQKPGIGLDIDWEKVAKLSERTL